MNLLRKIILEYASGLLDEESEAAKKAKEANLKNIHAMWWSPTGESPATHSTEGGQLQKLDKPKEVGKDKKEPEPDQEQPPKQQGEPEPESEPDESEPDQAKLLSSDASQVRAFAFGTKKSLAKQKKEREQYAKQGINQLKEFYGTNWYTKAKSTGEQLKLMGPNGTEQVKSSGEWAELFYTMKNTENVGLGTDNARAGEAAIVHGINKIIDLYKQNPDEFGFGSAMGELRTELSEAASQKGSLLKKSWADVAVSTVESIIDYYGIENIEFVTWDTKQGNTVVGSTGHGTSADMFLKLSDGKTTGVSLKKDFNVFFLSGGLATVLDSILDELPSSIADEIQGRVNIESYYKRREDAFSELGLVKGFRKEAMRMKTACENDDDACPFKKGSTSRNRLEAGALESAFKKIDAGQQSDLTVDEMKTLARLATESNNESAKEQVAKIRNIANETLEELFIIAVQNEQFGGLLKEKVVEGLHLPDTLGVGLTGLDEFVSYFGPERFDQDDMLNYFVTNEDDKVALKEAINSGNKAAINQFFIERISLTLDEESGKGVINFRRTDEEVEGEPMYLSIAFANVRERGLGAAPLFEVGVSNEFKYILKYGAKISDWDTRARKGFLRSRGKLEDDVEVNGWDDPAFQEAKDLIRRLAVRELEKYYGR